MRIEERIDNAVAWRKQVLLDKLKKDKGDYIVLDADIARTLDDERTTYYEDAIKTALLDYILKKRGVLVDETFKVTLFVQGKKAGGVFPMTIGPIFGFGGNDIETLKQDLVIPTTIKLVAEASKEFPFSEVESVTCCVEDNDFKE
jgi:hypothetical protein